jgi:hypothetical protein
LLQRSTQRYLIICIKLSLEEESNEHSNFRILSLNSAKSLGEPVLYGDQIELVNNSKSSWKLGIEELSSNSFEEGLEVNASEYA